MKNLYAILIYLLVILCGGCAVSEVIDGHGTLWGLVCVIAGLSLIVYIVRLPVDKNGY